jgi:predicted ferric reductase
VTRTAGRAALLMAYAAVLVVPILLTAGVVKPGARGTAVVFADALGFAALSLMALQVFSSGRWATTTRQFGLRAVLALHRQAGTAVLVLVVVHVVILNTPDAPGRARAGMVALVGLLALAATSAWRARLRLPYQRWRTLHLALTTTVIGAAFVHVMWVDSYTSIPVVRESMLGLVIVAAAALFWSRVGLPYIHAARPYTVVSVRPERGAAVTVELAPADGEDGMRFAPGQFARLRPASNPYSFDDHPFTLSSSADRPDRPAFTVKALGDFTGSLAAFAIDRRVLVDGPHGQALTEPRDGGGRLLVAAGIGITPAMSVLRTAAQRRDPRPLLLVYGSRRWVDVTFREELTELQRLLPGLRVVHVLSQPEPGWTGERGRIDGPLLQRVPLRDAERWTALVCGPPRLVATTERALLARGLPAAAIQAEGFD